MPGSSPNRFYPFPLDSDHQDTTAHIEALARAVDADAAAIANSVAVETAARAAADTDFLTNHVVRATVAGIDQSSRLLIQAAYAEFSLDMYAVAVINFPLPYAQVPIVVANASNSTQADVLGVELTTTTKCHVFGRQLTDGTPAFFHIVAFSWIAVGFQ